MIARFITLMLVAVLALPGTMLTPPADIGEASWGANALANGKKTSRKHDKKPARQTDSTPQFSPITRTSRETVTRTFTNTVPITIPNGTPATTEGKASSYPSTIDVTGFANAGITDVNLILNDVSHSSLVDVDILLSASDGRQALVLSDVAEGSGPTKIDLTLDDEAAAPMPAGTGTDDLPSGTYQPANHIYVPDTFAAPAPTTDGTVALSAFDGADPNGTWNLWVMDNASGDVGDMGGWALQITAETDIQVTDQAPVSAPDKGTTTHKKHKQQGQRRR
jgi:hypothetical protein